MKADPKVTRSQGKVYKLDFALFWHRQALSGV